MKAIEFSARISDNKIEVPDIYKNKLDNKGKLRVIILIDEKEDEKEWKTLSANQFLKGYGDSDAIYDNY